MWLQRKVATIGGNIHFVRALCLPPNVMIGERKVKIQLGRDYRAASRLLHPGDIIISRSRGFLSNKFIPGAFKHAMIFVGPVSGKIDPETKFITAPRMLPNCIGVHQTLNPRCVVHAVSEGIVCQDLLEVMNHCDYMAAVRPHGREASDPNANIVISSACEAVGKPYDFGFDWKNKKSFCCTELADHCLKKAGYQIPEPHMINTSLNPFGKKQPVTVSDSYIQVHKMVWHSLSCNETKFVKNAMDRPKMQKALADSLDADILNTEANK
jgi:hypothetical protein